MSNKNNIYTRSTPDAMYKVGRRRRNHVVLTLSLLCVVNKHVGQALVTTTRDRRSKRVISKDFSNDDIFRVTPSPDKTTKRNSAFKHGSENSDDEVDGNNEFFDSMNSFQELQRSTGSEILNEELQKQIDDASSSPDTFLDKHIGDASLLEKIAMSSIPQQLPRPAVAALNKKRNSSRGLNNSNQRVSPEQEKELGRIIQRGVSLHKLKTDFCEREGREINRKEWSELAGLKANELRRHVAQYRTAKQLLVSANIGLVHSVVKSQYQSPHKTGVSFDELIQEGSLGLLRAAELFDPSKGLRFSTYATIWIKGTLSNSHTSEQIRLPQREKTKWNKITKAHNDIAMEKGEPTVEEIAVRLDMNPSEVIKTKRKMAQVQALSLDYQTTTMSRSGTEGGELNMLENDKAFMEDVDLAERIRMHADVVAAMASNLDAREARLMRLRYGLIDGNARTLHECADAMGLSYTRTHQIAKKCLTKLREAAEAESLEEYLLTVA